MVCCTILYVLGKLTKLLIHAFLCPVCPPLCCFALTYVIKNVFSGDWDLLKYRNGASFKGTCWFDRSVYVAPFISPVSEIQGLYQQH